MPSGFWVTYHAVLVFHQDFIHLKALVRLGGDGHHIPFLRAAGAGGHSAVFRLVHDGGIGGVAGDDDVVPRRRQGDVACRHYKGDRLRAGVGEGDALRRPAGEAVAWPRTGADGDACTRKIAARARPGGIAAVYRDRIGCFKLRGQRCVLRECCAAFALCTAAIPAGKGLAFRRFGVGGPIRHRGTRVGV